MSDIRSQSMTDLPFHFPRCVFDFDKVQFIHFFLTVHEGFFLFFALVILTYSMVAKSFSFIFFLHVLYFRLFMFRSMIHFKLYFI